MLNSEEGERTAVEGWSSGLAQAKQLAFALNEALGSEPTEGAPPSGVPTAVIACDLPSERWMFVVVLMAVAGFGAFLRNVAWFGVLTGVVALTSLARVMPRRRLIVYAGTRQVVVETSVVGLFPKRTTFALARVRSAVMDAHDPMSRGAALLLEDGQHIPLTMYSNANAGAERLVEKVNGVLATARPA